MLPSEPHWDTSGFVEYLTLGDYYFEW